MDFENSFEVPLPPARAWGVLLDIPRIVRCVPGAELVEVVDPSTFKGKVTVKLGPVTMNFAGTVRFVEMDEANFHARADARGTDSKGRGGASAAVSFGLEPSPAGSRVTVRTVLSLSGAVAQYGRATGVVRELAQQITAEFAEDLRAQIAAEDAAGVRNAPQVQSAAAPGPTSEPRTLSAGRLVWTVIVAYLRRLFGRAA